MTLYEALTGRLPFEGSFHELRERKSAADPQPPGEIEPDVPEDLNAICMGLLCREPERRLSGRAVVEMLAATATVPNETLRAEPRQRKPPFVGRAEPLNILTEALGAARDGRGAGRVYSRAFRYRQDRAGAALPRPAGGPRRRRGASRPLL